jgi:uncharacterized phiE125 gp8 family phage protein
MTTIKTSAATTQFITLNEAKLHLRVDGSDEDSLITTLIAAAENACSAKTQRAIAQKTFQLALDAFPDSSIELQFPPLVSVQTIKYYDTNGVLQVVNSADYFLDKVSEPGWVSPAYGLVWPDTQERINAVVVDYTAGYTTLPEDLRVWMLLAIGFLYQNRSTANIGSSVTDLKFADGMLDTYKIAVL